MTAIRTRPPRVLFLSASGSLGGAELSLLEMMKALKRTPIDLCAALPAGPQSELGRALERENVPLHSLNEDTFPSPSHPMDWPQLLFRLAGTARQIRRLAVGEGVQLIHANTWKAALMAAGLPVLNTAPPCPLLLHHRDLAIPVGVRRLLNTRCTRGVAVSRVQESTTKKALPSLPLTTVHSGVDLSRFRDPLPQRDARERLGLPADGRLILGAANEAAWKRRDLFLKAVEILRREDPSIHGLLLGRDIHGPNGPPSDLQQTDGCRTQTLSESDMPLAYAAADLLLHPAEDEPFGRVIVEALASGLPIVTTRGGGPEETLRAVPGAVWTAVEKGNLQELADASRSLLHTPRQRGLDLSPFDVRNTTEQILTVYKEMLA